MGILGRDIAKTASERKAERDAKRQEFVDYYSTGDTARGLQQEMETIIEEHLQDKFIVLTL